MSQHDYVIGNASGAAVRADINVMAQAIAELNSGATEPTTKFAYQYWADTTTSLLKQRNGANTAWIIRQRLGATRVLPKSAAYTVIANDMDTLINCTSGTFTLSIAAAATLGADFFFRVRNSGTGIITVDPNGSETIDGSTTITLQIGEAITIISDGSNLFTLGRALSGAIIILTSGVTAVGDGATRYFGPADSTITESEVQINVPYAGTIKNLHAKSAAAPGTAHTYIYTVRKNAADTIVTCTTSGISAVSSNDTTNEVTVAQGDTISIKMVADDTSAPTQHAVSFELLAA